MKTLQCRRCWRRRPLKRLTRPGDVSPLGYGTRCVNEAACGAAVNRASRRDLRRSLGRESNSDGVLSSVMKHFDPHRRSARRGWSA